MADLVLHVDQTRSLGMIGASDAAAVLGLDPYRSPLSVALELRGEPRAERPAFVREAAEWGQTLEPLIRGKYALEQGRLVVVPRDSTVRDGWLRCTPDGFSGPLCDNHGPRTVEGDHTDWWYEHELGEVGLLQVKTCSAYKADEWKDGAIPEGYEIQVRVEMAVTKLPWCDVVCLVGGQTYVGPIRIVRDLEIEARILRDLRAFWDRCVIGGELPDVDASQSWREFASARMRPTKVEIESTYDDDILLVEWRIARTERKAAEQREELCKTGLLLRLADAGATKMVSQHGNVTSYKTGDRSDWKGYAISLGGYPKPPPDYVKPATKWAIRAPKSWGDDDAE